MSSTKRALERKRFNFSCVNNMLLLSAYKMWMCGANFSGISTVLVPGCEVSSVSITYSYSCFSVIENPENT